MSFDIDAIRNREAAATPGPWSWRGYSKEDPCLVGGRTRVVLSVIRRERQADDPETKSFVSHLHECEMPQVDGEGEVTYRPLTEEEIAERVRDEWLNDPWGGPAYDNRLAFRDHGTNLMEYARDLPVAEHPDAEFIRHARTDIPALLAKLEEQQVTLAWGADTIKRLKGEIHTLTNSEDSQAVLAEAEAKRLRSALEISLRSNVMCRHRLATTADEVAEHLADCSPAGAALVAHEGTADEVIATMLAEGWRLSEHVEYLAGKRIRVLRGPDAGPYAAIDDPGQEIERLTAENAGLRDELGNARDWEAFGRLTRERDRAELDVTRLTDALQRSVAKECGALCKEVESDRDEWERRAKAAEAELAKLNNAITWETSCLNCARLLDASYAETVRAERAEAELGRAKPVLDAADAVTACFRERDTSTPITGPLARLAKAMDELTRHVDPGGGDCPRCNEIEDEAVRRQCPEGLVSPDSSMVIRCVRDGGHEGNHWNRDRETEWEPIAAVDDEEIPDGCMCGIVGTHPPCVWCETNATSATEAICSRCGGRDGTHTVRNCAEAVAE